MTNETGHDIEWGEPLPGSVAAQYEDEPGLMVKCDGSAQCASYWTYNAEEPAYQLPASHAHYQPWKPDPRTVQACIDVVEKYDPEQTYVVSPLRRLLPVDPDVEAVQEILNAWHDGVLALTPASRYRPDFQAALAVYKKHKGAV